MICSAARLECSGTHLFVKWAQTTPEGFFRAEAAGLRLLGSTGTIRVPEVVCARDHGPAPFLVLEWLDGMTSPGTTAWRRLGERIAMLHAARPAGTQRYGLHHDNFLGQMAQPNGPMPTWGAFFRDRRLGPQVAAAHRGGMLPEREWLLNDVLAVVEDRLAGLREGPALVHGDLWVGNVLHLADGPALVDPAAYWAEREVEIAYTQLFGGFDRSFYEAYCSNYPLADGYERRRPVHQLYHLLAHLNHFGAGEYGPACDACCRSILNG